MIIRRVSASNNAVADMHVTSSRFPMTIYGILFNPLGSVAPVRSVLLVH